MSQKIQKLGQGKPLGQSFSQRYNSPYFKFSLFRPLKMGFTEKSIASKLTELYISEVAKMGMVFVANGVIEDRIAKVAKWLLNKTTKGSLVLNGGVGSGKSTMARAILNYFLFVRELATKRERELRQVNVDLLDDADKIKLTEQKRAFATIASYTPLPQFISATEYVRLVTSNNSEVEISNVRFARMLILDDMGVEPIKANDYGTSLMPITDLVYYKYDHQKQIIITTNASKKQLTDRYGERVADRLLEMCDWLGFENNSYRK